MKAAIIGAGIIGLTLARELRRRGAEVFLVDPRPPAMEATFAAAGLLAPSSEAEAPSDFFDLCRAGAAAWPECARELEDQTGLPTGYHADPTLYLYHTAEERERLEKRFAWQRERGIPAVHMDTQEVRVLQPEVRAAGGYLLPGDCHVNSRVFCLVLAEACHRAGINVHKGKVTDVSERGGRAAGVKLADGSELAADAVVNAAGAWASHIAVPLAAPVVVRPVKGHMLAMYTKRWEPKHILHDASVYMVPRPGPLLAIGSTMEEAGFDRTIKPEVIAGLRAAAERLVPLLTEYDTVETWVGLRPATADGRPVIGPTALPGYFLATGHFRNGILLAPLTAQLLAPVILGGEPDPLLAPFLPKS